jgi:hypothetical protein
MVSFGADDDRGQMRIEIVVALGGPTHVWLAVAILAEPRRRLLGDGTSAVNLVLVHEQAVPLRRVPHELGSRSAHSFGVKKGQW